MSRPVVTFELTPSGAEKFAKITRENKGKQLAIMLDGKEQSAPRINEEIAGGSGSISGNFTMEFGKFTKIRCTSCRNKNC